MQIVDLIRTDFENTAKSSSTYASNLTRPTAAFVTFENAYGQSLALKTHEKKDRNLLSNKFRFKQASEPTDIIWENRHRTEWNLFFRELFSATLVGLLLLGSFMFIFKVSRYSASIAKVFPVVNCEAV